jgi:hypothetical protein
MFIRAATVYARPRKFATRPKILNAKNVKRIVLDTLIDLGPPTDGSEGGIGLSTDLSGPESNGTTVLTI